MFHCVAPIDFAELVGDQLLPPVPPVVVSAQAEEDDGVQVARRPLVAEETSAEEVLTWMLYLFRRCVQSATRVRRRMRCKAADQHRLARAARGDCELAFPFTLRTDARWFFQASLALAVGLKVTYVKEIAGRLWSATETRVQDRWCALYSLVGRHWKAVAEAELRAQVARRVSVVGYGFLLTYFTDLHRELAGYPEWIAAWVTSGQLRAELGGCVEVDSAFDEFWTFVQSLRRPDAPLDWVGCCFEVCMESRVRGRIHAHAYISLDPVRMAGGNEVSPVELTLGELRWRKISPHVVPLSMRMKSRPNFQAAATGYYYVTANKASQIRVRGNQRLFQELWFVAWGARVARVRLGSSCVVRGRCVSAGGRFHSSVGCICMRACVLPPGSSPAPFGDRFPLPQEED